MNPYPGHGAELNLDGIRQALDEEDWEESPHDPDQEQRSVFLGTVFGCTPSGKFYMPFACGNLNPCLTCKGHGQLPNYKKRKSRSLAKSSRYSNRCRAYRSCTACGGLGSREAHLDELWREYAESVCESIGAFLESGEGDPCDLFITECRDRGFDGLDSEDLREHAETGGRFPMGWK